MTSRRTSWLLVAAVAAVITRSTLADTRIAYAPNQSALNILDQPAGTITPVPTSGFGGQIVNDPDWSPDGQWLAFHAGTSGSAQIYKIHPDGSGQQPLGTTSTGDAVDPDFSPNGAKLIFQAGSRQLWTINANGTGLSSLSAWGIGARWSPSGNVIAYGGQPSAGSGPIQHDLYLLNLGTMVVTNLVDLTGADSISSVAWSPDGTEIAAAIGDSSGASRIVIYDSTSGALLNNLTSSFSLAGSTYLDWAPGGEKIVFTGNHSTNVDLWEVNVTGAPVFSNLTNSPGVAEWAPSVIPEPASLAGLSVLGLVAMRKRRN